MAINLIADTRSYDVPMDRIREICMQIGILTEDKIRRLSSDHRYCIGRLTKIYVGQEVVSCSPIRYFIFNAVNGIRSVSYPSMDELKRNEILPLDIWSADRINKMRELFYTNNPDTESAIEIAKNIGMLTDEKIENLSQEERKAITTFTKRCIVEYAAEGLIPKQYALVNTVNGLKSKTYDSRYELEEKDLDIDIAWTKEEISHRHLLYSIISSAPNVAYSRTVLDNCVISKNAPIGAKPLVPDECFKSKEHIKFKDRNRSIDICIDPEIKF